MAQMKIEPAIIVEACEKWLAKSLSEDRENRRFTQPSLDDKLREYDLAMKIKEMATYAMKYCCDFYLDSDEYTLLGSFL